MGDRRNIVVTTYGHNKTIDRIAVSLFEAAEGHYYRAEESNAKTYCDMINSLALKGDSWVSAKKVSENTQLRFSDIIIKLDDLTIQKILIKIDRQELAKALTNHDEIVKKKIFKNMSKKGGAQMLKEDMGFAWVFGIAEVKKVRKRF